MLDPDTVDKLLAAVAFIKDAKNIDKALGEIKAEQDALHDLAVTNEQQSNVLKIREDSVAAQLVAAVRIEGENRYWQTQNEAKERELSERAAALNERQAALEQAEAEVKQRTAKLGELSNGLDQMDANLKARETIVDEKHAAAEALLAQYDADKHAAAVKLAGD